MQFKEKEAIMRYLFAMRNKRILINRMKDQNRDIFLDAIDNGLNSLPAQLREIIYNEFVLNMPSDWWLDYYSKSSYYRLKNKAIDIFLDCLKW